MKEEALKLADELDALHQYVPTEAPAMIRRLVEELDCSESYIKQYQLERKPTITKLDGKVVAVTMTDDEHRIAEVLWEAPKPLSDEEIWELHQEHIDEIPCGHSMKTIGFVEFARAIEERHGIK